MKRTDEQRGRGETSVSMDEVREAFGLLEASTQGKKGFIDSPLFQGISAQTKRNFTEALRQNRRTVQADEVMTRHSVEIGGSGSKSPLNPLWVGDATPIRANLYDLPENPRDKSKKQLGNTGEFEVLGLRAWFAGAVETPVAIVPGLQVRSAAKQIVTRIPSLAEMSIPENDLARLMDNTSGIFSRLLSTDNSATIVTEAEYTPHQLPTMLEEEIRAFSGVPGSKEVRLEIHEGFKPSKKLAGPHAIVLRGEGVFISNTHVAMHRGKGLNRILNAGVVPLAKVEGDTLAFQWVGLDTTRNEASATFFPTSEASTAKYVPIKDDLTLRLLTLNSMAETAASMHRHIGRLEAKEGFLKKAGKDFSKRLAGLKGLLGF